MTVVVGSGECKGSGARRGIERIVPVWVGRRLPSPSLSPTRRPKADLDACSNLGATLAALLMGVESKPRGAASVGSGPLIRHLRFAVRLQLRNKSAGKVDQRRDLAEVVQDVAG